MGHCSAGATVKSNPLSILYSLVTHCVRAVIRLIEEGFAPCVCLSVAVVKCSDGSVVSRFDLPKTSLLDFSPRGTILVTWQVYSSEFPQSGGASPDVEGPGG